MIASIEQFIGLVYWIAPFLLVIALLVWLVLSMVLIAGRLLYDRNQRFFREVQSRGDTADARRILKRLPAAIVIRAALDPATPAATAGLLARHALPRLGVERLVRIASKETGNRHDTRRVRALRLLAFAGHPARIPLLDAALHSGREEVVDGAVSLLGMLEEEAAAILLIGALRERLFPTSRVATELDHFHIPIPQLVKPLLDATDSGLRYWGVALAARYLKSEGFRDSVLRLTGDAEPQVRKAAIQALRSFPDAAVGEEAARLTRDPVFYVRAHAARTLAACRDGSAVPCIVSLLADRDWWVRLAARESLVTFGSAVVPAVLPMLESSDPVVAEGAAEILHNVGFVTELMPKLAKCSEEVAAAFFKPLVVAGGELFISTVLARSSSAEVPSLAWLEPALRRAARR